MYRFPRMFYPKNQPPFRWKDVEKLKTILIENEEMYNQHKEDIVDHPDDLEKPDFSNVDFNQMTKKKLIEFADQFLDLNLDMEMRKSSMIEDIQEAIEE